MALRDYLNEQLLGIVASYQSTGVVHHIGVVYPKRNNQLQIFIPRGHALALGSLVTVHLDNRTGIDELDAELGPEGQRQVRPLRPPLVRRREAVRRPGQRGSAVAPVAVQAGAARAVR